ncbi:CPCC family cysteine-rich protein [Marininema halotolerans]|uniref:Cysteine-rich CPCC n=1 Tax=Marininema halotolerans TaxID=1155944 RepID=A0A1I6UV15_9BACL|nr:CPCC family cysteine-rich protein [Marininema halotolerans]SFT05174.1 Cysteine-rich CPCC [Marininema halotolerans]
MFERSPCPCCGYLTFDEDSLGEYEICDVCFWEDDPIQRENPTVAGGANVESLEQARANFVRIGAMSIGLIKHVRKPLPEEIPPR